MKRIWKSAPWLLCLGLAVLLAWNHWRPSPGPRPGPVELPKEILTQPGQMTDVEAVTKAENVTWLPGERPDGAPAPQMRRIGPKAIVWQANAKGRYYLVAAVTVGGEVKTAETVMVVGDAPPPGPGPGPTPPPGPLDEFQKALKLAYDSERDDATLVQLIDLFDAGAIQVRDAPSKTVYEFNRGFADAGRKLVGDKLPKTRQTIFVLLGQRIGNDTSAALDGPTRTKIAEVFLYVADSLRKVR